MRLEINSKIVCVCERERERERERVRERGSFNSREPKKKNAIAKQISHRNS